MAISEQGRILAQLKADTGLPWQTIAESIGASSGDYVRKVASGAKPGNNLRENLAQLMTTGKVERAVPRRTDKAGRVARVRGSAGAERRPSQQTVRDGAPRYFRRPDGRTGWARSTGTGRDTDSFLDTLTRAGKGRHDRVQLRVKVRDKRGGTRWVEVGGKGGYDRRDVRAGVRSSGSVGEWIGSQTRGRAYAGEVDADTIIDVEVIAL